MSHLQRLSQEKFLCESSNQCAAYDTLLATEYKRVDTNLNSAIQNTVTTGMLIGLVGLVVLATPFVKLFQRFFRFLLPKLLIAAPVIAGLVVGAGVGFAITFSACFKQQCSTGEESAIFIVPLLTLAVTVPLGIFMAKKHKVLTDFVGRIKPVVWIVVGLIIIGLAMSSMLQGIVDKRQVAEQQKRSIQLNADR